MCQPGNGVPAENQKRLAIADLQPMQQSKQLVKQVESAITPQEMQIAKYHRNSIKTGNVGRDSEGRPITVYSNTIEIPEGPNKGKFVTVPGWFDGKAHEDEKTIYNKWKGEIQNDKWPVYSDPKVAGERAVFIHKIMDAEGDGSPKP